MSAWRTHPAAEVFPLLKGVEAGVLEQGASNPRVDFRRLKDQLAERGLIGEWNNLMWAVQPTSTQGDLP